MDPTLRDNLFPAAKLFCNSDFLDTFQNTPLRKFTDSKTLVDLQLKCNPEQALHKFSQFSNGLSQEEYDEFMSTVFEHPNSETALVRHFVPTDYTDTLPDFATKIDTLHPILLDFIADLNKRWKDLCRKFAVQESKDVSGVQSSLIALPHPFFIPGGRFRECYYWDTLWIIKGLLTCKMLESAKGAVRNLFHLLDRVGFVPNGNRVYYLNRSQPPMLTEMVRIIFDAIPDANEQLEWLKESVPYLDKEYEWFEKTHSCAAVAQNERLQRLHLSMYCVNTSDPRPESFNEDVATSRRHQERERRNSDAEDDKCVYAHLASGAESGWDFSSRWTLGHAEGLEGITTCNIVPCCLNSILLRVESTLAEFHSSLAYADSKVNLSGTEAKHLSKSKWYKQLAQARKKSIRELLWDPAGGFWFDFDSVSGERSNVVSCAGLMPLWAGCGSEWELEDAKRFVEFVMTKSGLLGAGGLFCTSQGSGEQWDFPNCWPPLVDIAVEALNKLDKALPECGAGEAATEIAGRFLTTAFHGWREGGVMHEKYDARVNDGRRGEGGEYEPQTGFGWTNGAVLWLLRQYPAVISIS